MNLYEITGEILQLQEMLEAGEDEQTVNDTLEAVMADFEDKADAYGAVIRNLEAQAEAYKAESLPKGFTLESLPEDVRENYVRYKEPELDKKKLLADVKAGVVKDIELVRTRSLILK